MDKRLRAMHRPQVILEGSGSFIADSESPESLPPHGRVAAEGYPTGSSMLPARCWPEPGQSHAPHPQAHRISANARTGNDAAFLAFHGTAKNRNAFP